MILIWNYKGIEKMSKHKINKLLEGIIKEPEPFERLLERSERSKEASEKNKPIAKEWFDIAQDDIQVSHLLMKNKYFAASVYHLQQAFEKLTKCYFILSGMEPEQARDHRFILKRLKSEIKDKYIQDFLDLSKGADSPKVSLDDFGKVLEVIEKSEDGLRRINAGEIRNIFTILNNLEKKILNKHLVESIQEKLKQKKFLKRLKHLIFQITRFRTSDSQVGSLTNAKQVEVILSSNVIGIKLNLLSMITYAHFNTPRYPSIKDSGVTFKTYTSELGIVEGLSLFIEEFKHIAKGIGLEFSEDPTLSRKE